MLIVFIAQDYRSSDIVVEQDEVYMIPCKPAYGVVSTILNRQLGITKNLFMLQ